MRKLVLLGGGYGGMRILQRILPSLPDDMEVTLVDQNPYHCLKTEYYALAAGTISDTYVRVPFPYHSRLTFVNDEVTKIDLENNKVHILNGEAITYDELIIGLGCTDKYHNVPGAAEYTHSIQTIESARKTYTTLNNLPAQSTVAVVGAGLSGVEITSEIRESRPDLRVMLFDRGHTILSSFPERLSNYVENWMIEHNVEVINNANITRVEENTIYNHDEPMACDAVVWTAGIQPVKVVRDLDVEKDNQGRIKLTNQHYIPNMPSVFVVGDCASLPQAPSAQLAEGQAEQIAVVLLKRWAGEPEPESFPTIKLKGVLGSLGKKHGFGVVADRALIGRVPRLLKSGVLWMYKNHNG